MAPSMILKPMSWRLPGRQIELKGVGSVTLQRHVSKIVGFGAMYSGFGTEGTGRNAREGTGGAQWVLRPINQKYEFNIKT